MAGTTIVDSGLDVRGHITAQSMSVPAAAVSDSSIVTAAGIDEDKLRHMDTPGTAFGFGLTGSIGVGTQEHIIWVCDRACTLRLAKWTMFDTGTTGNSDCRFYKGGSASGTALDSAATNLASTDADGTIRSNTLSVTSLVAGDIVTALLTINSSHDGTGPYAWIELDHAATA